MLARQPFGALQIDYEGAFRKNLGKVFAGELALVHYRKRSLPDSRYAAEVQFLNEGPFVDLLEKTCTGRVGNLEHRSQHLLSQMVKTFAFI